MGLLHTTWLRNRIHVTGALGASLRQELRGSGLFGLFLCLSDDPGPDMSRFPDSTAANCASRIQTRSIRTPEDSTWAGIWAERLRHATDLNLRSPWRHGDNRKISKEKFEKLKRTAHELHPPRGSDRLSVEKAAKVLQNHFMCFLSCLVCSGRQRQWGWGWHRFQGIKNLNSPIKPAQGFLGLMSTYVGWCCIWINLRRPHPSRPEHGCALETQGHHCGLLRSILDVGSIKVDLITRKAALVVCCACPGHLGMARSREASLSPGNFGAHHAGIDRSIRCHVQAQEFA